MYSPNFVIGIYGPKSIQKHITVETEAAPYEITIGLLEICSLGHRRQIWHNHRKVDVWDDIWTSYRDLVFQPVRNEHRLPSSIQRVSGSSSSRCNAVLRVRHAVHHRPT